MTKPKTKLTRTAKTSVSILSGEDILRQGHHLAGDLWNESILYLKKTTPYPGRWNLQKALRPDWRTLSDRVFSYAILDAHIAWRAFLTHRANGNTRARPPAPSTAPRPLTFEVKRNAFPLGDWTYRLTVLGREIDARHAVVKLRVQPGLKMKQVKLIRLAPSGNTGELIYTIPPRLSPGDAIAGVDLGIINLAVVAFDNGESILYTGRGLLSSDRYFHKRAQKCKPSGWQPGEKRFAHSTRQRNFYRKAGNIRRMAIHNLTRHLVEQCVRRGVGTLLVGDLRHIREGRNFGRTNQKFHAWPFAQLTEQLTYKAEAAGIEVKLVDERGTSSHCHRCGQKGQRPKRGLFHCPSCKLSLNADLNGAFNILNKATPSPVFSSGASPTLKFRFDLKTFKIQ